MTLSSLKTPHGDLHFPLFLPDATKAVVRAVDSVDLENCQTEALVMNAYHLMQHPGSSTVKALGGLHHMSGWQRPIVTDSGGFQVYSLIRQNAKLGSLSNKGAVFQTDPAAKKIKLTPEKSIQLQMAFGADVMFCFDDCTHAADPYEAQRESVTRTIAWAHRCRQEFDRLVADKKLSDNDSPLLFAVVQGGDDHDLRRECAEALLDIGFDGYGFGGYPLDADGNFLTEMFGYTRELIPDHYPLHALGVGHPANVVASYQLGYQMFDSAMPTRDARQGRLYCFNSDEGFSSDPKGDWFDYVYITDNKYIKADVPLCEHSAADVSHRYSRGYLNHLFSINETTALRIATLHNLSFMNQLIARLRADGAV